MTGTTEMDLYKTTLLLQKIYPIDVGIHIAFEANAGLMKQWCEWNVRSALLLDISPDMVTWTGTDNLPAGWYYKKVRHDDTACNIRLHENIATSHRQEHYEIATECFETRLLESHLSQLNPGQSIWATINCLPALHLLQATIKLIDQCCVLLVRVSLEQSGPGFTGAGFNDVDRFLRPKGFSFLQMFNTGSELTRDALYVRECRSMMNAVKQKPDSPINASNSELDKLKAENDNLTMQKNILENRIYELELHQDLMTKQLSVAEEHLNTLNKIIIQSHTTT